MKISAQAAPFLHIETPADGVATLYVSTLHRGDPAVQSAIASCVKKYPGIRLSPVPLDELRVLQQQNAVTAVSADHSAEQARVIELFREAKKRHASDIHFLIGMDNLTQVQMRIHGDLETYCTLETEEGMTLASTIVMSMCDVTEKSFNPKRQQDGRVKKDFLTGLGLFGARYSHTATEFGLYVVMRILPDEGKAPPTLDQLGYLPGQQTLIHRMLKIPEGVIILSGPTGSGKSTSLRSFSAKYLAITGNLRRLLTIEDPPEGRIHGAVQTAIIADRNNPDDVSQAWVRAISGSMRLDPDAIIVGEIREANSARTTLSAGRSGHVVLSTTHANDAIGILARMTDSFGIPLAEITDPQMIVGLLSQRLVQLLCPHCKYTWDDVKATLPPEELTLLMEYCDTATLAFRNRAGCTHSDCHKGITGRRVIAEVIRPDARFMHLLRQQDTIAARSYWVHTLGGITRRQHLEHYLRDGLVDPLDADRICPLDEDRRTLLPAEVLNEH